MDEEDDKGAKRKASARFARKQELADLRWLLGQPQGRRLMWRIILRSGINRTSWTGNEGTYFNEGRRDMGLWLLAEATEAAPGAQEMMITEHRKEQENV